LDPVQKAIDHKKHKRKLIKQANYNFKISNNLFLSQKTEKSMK